MIKKLPKERNPRETKWLEISLAELFGSPGDDVVRFFMQESEWMSAESGDVLFNKGDEADGLYILIQGRMLVMDQDDSGNKIKIAEIGRGETIGEMAIFTGDPRNAEVKAIRNSILAKLSRNSYKAFAVLFPELNLNIFQLVISRLKNQPNERKFNPPVTLCLVDLNAVPDVFYDQFKSSISEHTDLCWVDLNLIEKSGISIGSDLSFSVKNADSLSNWLRNLELEAGMMVFDTRKFSDDLKRLCAAHADAVMMVSDFDTAVTLSASEQLISLETAAEQCFVFVHPSDSRTPYGTAERLKVRPHINRHFHVRQGHLKDIRRLCRLITGHGIGLVLAGGGAKGFSHLGVYKALAEKGIELDFIGGTSIGAMNAAALAFDAPVNETIIHMKKAALYHPTRDFNLLPLVSLIRGKRLEHLVRTAIHDFSGREDVDITDTWIPLYVISSNYSKARQEIHLNGSLKKTLLASAAIPGIFPPVVHGNDLLLDGGSFNNFPTDVMRREGIERIIGSDFTVEKNYELKFENIPGPWKLLYYKIVYGKKNIYKVPSLVSIMLNTTLLYSNAKRSESLKITDLHFHPPVEKLGFTDWKSFDLFVEAGYKHASEKLSEMSVEELSEWKKYN